ncbi:MAG: SRPBCC family protein [Flavobacteriia bacterium]|nr:SRPBCC family protein [Flavobacteriia bacterium]
MKWIKRILLFLLTLVILFLIIAIFIKKEYRVEREIKISQPLEKVFSYVKLLKNQNEYSKWAGLDPGMKKFYKGKDGEKGFISGWKSKKSDVGSGEQEIINIIENKQIDYEIRFKEPFESTSNARLSLNSISSNECRVVWSFDGKMNYPMNLMLLFMDFETMIGNDLQYGINKLKRIIEKN